MANLVDLAVSKARGLEKSMEAHRDGLIGVFQTLVKQHGEALALIDRVEEHDAKRAALWPTIRAALLVHERGELRAVYPSLARWPGLEVLAAQHDDQARELADMIERLDAMTVESSEWGNLFDDLARAVAEHATEEELEIFPAALIVVGPVQAKVLDARLRAAQKQIRATLETSRH